MKHAAEVLVLWLVWASLKAQGALPDSPATTPTRSPLAIAPTSLASPATAATGRPAEAQTVLGIHEGRFTLNGRPVFLLGLSYYGALGATDSFICRDLEDAQRLGFNWLRVWATWSAFDIDVSAVGTDGQAREPFFERLRWLVAECDRRGLVVDVTLTRGERTSAAAIPGRLSDFAAHQRAVEAVVNALEPHRNWYLDLANERDVRDARYVSPAELKTLRERVRQLDPSRLVTASFGGHDLSEHDVREALLRIGLDFLSPHRPRSPESPGQTEARTRECWDLMQKVGRLAPVHHQEPFRRGYGSWEPVAGDFLTDLRGAVAGGAAGWCLHNGSRRNAPGEEPRRSFDLRTRRLFDQWDEEERKVLAEASTLVQPADPGGALPVIEGPAVAWHPLTLSFSGPEADETQSSPNPFLDYRFEVAFTGPSGQICRVPGYFDGDGSGGPRGHVWRVRFSADGGGLWRYRVTFRRGPQVAVQLDAAVGTPLAPDGVSGSFTVAPRNPQAPGFLKWGRLAYVGKHYLKFQDGPYWIRGGTDEPENLLAYSGFDHTPPSHHYATHAQEWRPGDPDWGEGRGRALIGALNYLSRQHVNSIYFLTMNIGGDGKDVWPWAGTPDPKGNAANDNLHFDLGKLRQWEVVFAHAQRQGLFLHVVLNEAEAANKRELDDGELGPERKLYYRELIARFGHHLALEWNLCEEYNLDFNFEPGRVRAFADYLRAVDPYGHPIAVHSAGNPVEQLQFTLGDPRFSMMSVQLNQRPIHEVTEILRRATAAAGRPLPVSLDEFTVDRGQPASHLPVDDPEGHRKEKLWPTYFSGGMIEFILEDMLQTESFETPPRATLWRYVAIARQFMEEHLPFWEMEPADDLAQGGATLPVGIGGGRTVALGPQVFAKHGGIYAVYLPKGDPSGSLDLTGLRGAADQRWFNPRTGQFEGDARDIRAGTRIGLGPPPSAPEEDWVVLIQSLRRRSAAGTSCAPSQGGEVRRAPD